MMTDEQIKLFFFFVATTLASLAVRVKTEADKSGDLISISVAK